MTIQSDFTQLTDKFLQIKDTQHKQSFNELIERVQHVINKYRDVLDVSEQIVLAQLFELQLILYTLTDQREQAAIIENILNEEFLGIHKIGKPFDNKPHLANIVKRTLNVSASLLDMERLKTLAIKQKGTTKPKLLGWILKLIGLIFIAIAAWLFTKQWLWTPLIIGILGVFLSTIGTQVSNIVNKFLSTIVFNAGIIIPATVTYIDDNIYEVVFLAPLMDGQQQPIRWGVKKISFRKAIGDLKLGEQLAGVCILSQSIANYHSDFMPTLVCLGYRNDIIPFKAKLTITDKEWQCLNKIIEKYQNKITNNLLTLDEDLQQIS